MRALICCLVLSAVLTAPAHAARLTTPPADRFAAKLLACDSEDHSAIFRGSMKVLKGAPGMEILFLLQVRGEDAQGFGDSGAPAPFGVWRAADMGRKRYVSDQTVANLPVGSAYRVLVRYRWRNAAGAVVAKAALRSKPCAQPETRPNFHITSIRPGEHYADGSREFEVGYLNDGVSDVDGPFAVSLTVTGRPPVTVTDADLAAGDRNDAAFTLPSCPAGSELTAVVDSSALIEEDNEADNSLTVPCPT